MAFFFFMLVNAILFIRPAEVVPGLELLPIYEVLIVTCACVALPSLVNSLKLRNLQGTPVMVCVFLLPLAVILSHVSHALFGYALEMVTEFSKVVLYFWLFISIINTPVRVERFLVWLVGFVVVLSALALLQYHEVIDIPSLTKLEQREVDEETGEVTYTPRLRSTGIYNDPNDLSLILLVGIMVCLYKLTNPEAVFSRFLWLAPLLLFGYGLALTKSRGGFLALMISAFLLIRSRYGWAKSLALSSLVVPVLFVLFSGRQTDLSAASSGTGQSRIQLWSEGLLLFKSAPLFGIGYGYFDDEVGLVAHNSFVHCYTELGFLGGTLFLGAFVGAFWTLFRAGRLETFELDPYTLRLRSYLMAILAATGVGLLTLSRAYVAPTYMVLGLACVFSHLQLDENTSLPILSVNGKTVQRMLLISVGFLALLYIFVRTFVRW